MEPAGKVFWPPQLSFPGLQKSLLLACSSRRPSPVLLCASSGCCVVQADRCQRAAGRAVPRRPVQDRPDVTWPRDLHAETHPHGSEGLGGGPGRPVTRVPVRVWSF